MGCKCCFNTPHIKYTSPLSQPWELAAVATKIGGAVGETAASVASRMLAGFAEMGAMARGEVDGGERIYRAMQEGGQVCSPWELRRSGVGNPAAAAALLDAQRRRIQTHYTKDGVPCAAGTVGAIKHDSGGAAAKGALRPPPPPAPPPAPPPPPAPSPPPRRLLARTKRIQ
jgi:hypothetical protein